MNLPQRLLWNPELINLIHWNPYQQSFSNIQELIDTYGSYIYILGPTNVDKKQYLWLFKITPSSIVSCLTKEPDNDPCIKITQNEQNAKIDYIHSCEPYQGKQQIEWIIQILKSIHIKEITLFDYSSKFCHTQTFQEQILLSIVHLLWKGTTYYQTFGFQTEKEDQLLKLIEKLKNLSWNDMNEFPMNHKNKLIQSFQQYYQLYGRFTYGPFSAFIHFLPDNCGLFYDFLTLYQRNYKLPLKDVYQELKSIVSKNKWVLHL